MRPSGPRVVPDMSAATTTGTTPTRPVITSEDRLVTTLFFAAVVHAIVILGLGFSGAAQPPQTISRLEVTMVMPHPETRPDEADYLAQMDQRGDGRTGERTRPMDPASTPAQLDNPGLSEAPDPEHATPGEQTREHPDSVHEADSGEPEAILTRGDSPHQLQTSPQPGATEDEQLRFARLIQEQLDQITPVDDERREQAVSSDPEETPFETVDAHARDYAAYLDEWRNQVERVGNLNFPDEAVRSGLSGSVMVEVTLEADGRLADIYIVRPSGHRILDDAVLNILRLAEPFAPFNQAMRQNHERLRFTYEWRFRPSGEGESGGRILGRQ